jgi:hypothetical protein
VEGGVDAVMLLFFQDVGMPADYINKLARMFQDIKVSEDLNQAFKDVYRTRSSMAGEIWLCSHQGEQNLHHGSSNYHVHVSAVKLQPTMSFSFRFCCDKNTECWSLGPQFREGSGIFTNYSK